MALNLTLYLVTDSTNPILGEGRDLIQVVDDAIKGGVTIVQYRDKHSDTVELISTAKKLHDVTKKHNMPLLINDRVDVALAMGAEGVHLGQDDMDLVTARKLLGDKAIIGATVSSVQEAMNAVEAGADYLGIGTMFATPTKDDTKVIIGTAGTKETLASLSAMDRKVPTVAIGGINISNVHRVLYQSKARFKGLDGVAVVSAIMAAEDPQKAATDLKNAIEGPPSFSPIGGMAKNKDPEALLSFVPSVVRKLGEQTPLCHNMTNLVVQNFAANVALCIGASPVMSNNGAEAQDLAKMKGALVLNMGTVTAGALSNYLQALKAYNTESGPVVFDPVGAGATEVRRNAVKQLMAGGYFDLIKGNEQEIKVVCGQGSLQQKGVDSGLSTSSATEKAQLVKNLAARERNVVLMTGTIDYLSDGTRTYAISNGHSLLGRITGSGCTLGTTIASFLAVHREDKLLAALAGILMFEIAAERAAGRDYAKGPGTFVPVFLDELFFINKQTANGQGDWCKAARVEVMDV